MASVDFCSLRAKAAGEPLQASAPECTSLHLIRRAKTEWHKEKAKDTKTADYLVNHYGDKIGRRPLFLYFCGAEELPDVISSVPLISDNLIAINDKKFADKPLRIFTICTDGKKDPCCAKFAYAIYAGLDELGTASNSYAVEVSHPGGCRFAPTLLCVPSGNCYGWVDPSDVAQLFDAEETKRIIPENYRGNIFHDEKMCWATYFAAKNSTHLDLDTVHYVDNKLGMSIHFREQNERQNRIVELMSKSEDYELHSGCFQAEGRRIKRTIYWEKDISDV